MSIKDKIAEDLKVYSQDNLFPKSLTVVEGDYWRHYELGPIYGFVVYNELEANGDQWFGIMSLEEDDEFWSIPQGPMSISAGWIEAVSETWKRVESWSKEYLRMGWEDDEHFGNPAYYKTELKKPLVPGEIR